MDLIREFVSNEARMFAFKIGNRIASGLSGFVAGIIVASMIWWVWIFIYSSL